MPTYQYRCTACREPLEVVQSFTEAARTECPTCGGALRKVFSAVGVVFKGSGFYQNDSRPAPKGEPAPAAASTKDGDSASSPGAKADGGAKSDPAAKSADKADKPAEKKNDKPAKKQSGGSGTHKVA